MRWVHTREETYEPVVIIDGKIVHLDSAYIIMFHPYFLPLPAIGTGKINRLFPIVCTYRRLSEYRIHDVTIRPFLPRCSFWLVYISLWSHLGSSTLPIGILVSLWGHGWHSTRTAFGSHLVQPLRGLGHSPHHPAGF